MRALFSCIPSEGHFRPLLPLARALAAAGHHVAFATAVDWHPRVAAEGFEALPNATRVVYDGLRHECLNEPEQDDVIAGIIAWLDQQLPAIAG